MLSLSLSLSRRKLVTLHHQIDLLGFAIHHQMPNERPTCTYETHHKPQSSTLTINNPITMKVKIRPLLVERQRDSEGKERDENQINQARLVKNLFEIDSARYANNIFKNLSYSSANIWDQIVW